jgi:hypothetical protein
MPISIFVHEYHKMNSRETFTSPAGVLLRL